jgi:hypothetical protein
MSLKVLDFLEPMGPDHDHHGDQGMHRSLLPSGWSGSGPGLLCPPYGTLSSWSVRRTPSPPDPGRAAVMKFHDSGDMLCPNPTLFFFSFSGFTSLPMGPGEVVHVTSCRSRINHTSCIAAPPRKARLLPRKRLKQRRIPRRGVECSQKLYRMIFTS